MRAPAGHGLSATLAALDAAASERDSLARARAADAAADAVIRSAGAGEGEGDGDGDGDGDGVVAALLDVSRLAASALRGGGALVRRAVAAAPPRPPIEDLSPIRGAASAVGNWAYL
jgi:hypothetical protein